MLTNSLWSMPSATRAGDAHSATIFYRCGSQQGRAAQVVSADISEDDFTRRTIDFVAAQTAEYRKAKASQQKNATRSLKKYFDAREISIIEAHKGELTDEQIITLLL